MDDLVEFEPTHTERTIVISSVNSRPYEFLRMSYQNEDEMHYNRLILRGPGYTRLIGALDKLLDGEHEEALVAVKRGNLGQSHLRAEPMVRLLCNCATNWISASKSSKIE